VSFVEMPLVMLSIVAVSREALEDYFGANDGGRALLALKAFVTKSFER